MALVNGTKSILRFPIKKVIDNSLRIVIDKLAPDRIDEAYTLYQHASDDGNGFGREEVRDSKFLDRLKQATVIGITNEDNGELVSVMPIVDSPGCRSVKPLLLTVYAMVKPQYTGKSLAAEQYGIAQAVGRDMGYLGANARAVITGRNFIPTRKIGSHFVGIIPFCSYLEGIGYMDDILIFKDFKLNEVDGMRYKQIIEERNKPLPPLLKVLANTLNVGNQFEMAEIKTKHGMVRIRSANSDSDVWRSEEIWRDSAERGEGFGLDEFNENGHFHRKFLKESNIILAENTDGKILGASIFGPSTLSRTVKPVLATTYVAVDQEHIQQGIGMSLLEHSLRILKSEGYRGCVSDTYIQNHKMLHLLKQTNFGFRGSLPRCGYLKGSGVSDSLLVYRDL